MKIKYMSNGKLYPVCMIDFEQNIILIKTEEHKKQWVKFEKERLIDFSLLQTE